jgi:hypothetical protein
MPEKSTELFLLWLRWTMVIIAGSLVLADVVRFLFG